MTLQFLGYEAGNKIVRPASGGGEAAACAMRWLQQILKEATSIQVTVNQSGFVLEAETPNGVEKMIYENSANRRTLCRINGHSSERVPDSAELRQLEGLRRAGLLLNFTYRFAATVPSALKN